MASCLSDDVHFLKSVLNFKTAENAADRRSAARVIYKAYLEESHKRSRASPSVGGSTFGLSAGSIPTIFGGQKQRRTNLEEEEVKEVRVHVSVKKNASYRCGQD